MSETISSKNHLTKLDEKEQRKRNKPDRYGATGEIDIVHNSDTEDDNNLDDPFADDSHDNLPYSPPKKTRIVATIRKPATKRACTGTDIVRFGRTENDIDHNSFFKSVSAANESLVLTNTHSSSDLFNKENTHSTDDASQKDDASQENKEKVHSIESILKFLIAKVDALQAQLIRIEVKVDSIRDIDDEVPTAARDMTKLLKAGLPVKDLESLKSLEKDLNDISKRTEIVSSNL